MLHATKTPVASAGTCVVVQTDRDMLTSVNALG